MNTTPTGPADAPVPPEGTEQAVDQAAKQQQPPPAESSVLETVSNVVDGVATVADVATSVLDVFG